MAKNSKFDIPTPYFPDDLKYGKRGEAVVERFLKDIVSATKVGNYVRLPYLGGLVDTPVRRVILDDNDQPMPLQVFVTQAMRERTAPERIQFLASHYVPPKRVIPTVDFSDLADEDLEQALASTSQLVRIIWKRGPLESQDRSTALMRLAHQCRDSGITPSMCRAIVIDADKRWGKFHARGDEGMEQINKLVERAYLRG